MGCEYSQLMLCEECRRVWCVPGTTQARGVFHEFCGSELVYLGVSTKCEDVTRGIVRATGKDGRLEVRSDVEG